MEGCTFLRICPFFLGCPFYWHRVACTSLLWSFVYLWYLCDFCFFIYNFIDLSPLPFFLDESGQSFSNFVYLLKELVFNFIDLFSHFLLYFFYFCSDLYDLFPSTIHFVCSSFSSFFRCKVRLFI